MIKKVYIIILISILLIINLCSCTKSSKYNSWHLNKMNVDELWNYSTGESQTIAFIDTGISNELLDEYDSRIAFKYNVIDDTVDVEDKHGHGTQMVSVACSNSNNIVGIAPDANIIIIKAVDDEGKTNNDYLLEALQYSIDNNATIINISLGGYKTSDAVIKLMNEAILQKITIVAAAGDYENKDLLFPANQAGVISTEAKTENDEIWSLSNTSANSIIAFPGENITVLSIENNELKLIEADGTSIGTAIASGYIALIKDYAKKCNIDIDNEMLTEFLQSLNSKMEGGKVDYLLPFKELK